MRGSGDDGFAGCGLHHARHHRVGHGAVMRSVAAAAGGQARVVVGCERGRKRPQPEKQNEEDGESAPHLQLMVHEELAGQGTGSFDAGVRYHRFIADFQLQMRGNAGA